MNKALLTNLHQTPEFKILLKELRSNKPLIPLYDPEINNIEAIKFASAQSRAYDLFMGIMAPWGDVEV